MFALQSAMARFFADESAVTAIDYSLIVTLVSIAAVVFFDGIGKTLIALDQVAASSIASTTP